MDQFFRIALCACLCLGGLQATPVRSKRAEQQCTIDKESLILSELDKVLCQNVALSSPTNVTLNCYDDALVHYIEQLFFVHKNCNNTDFVMDSVEALDSCKPRAGNCSLTLSIHNTFESFKTDLETFVEEFHDQRMK